MKMGYYANLQIEAMAAGHSHRHLHPARVHDRRASAVGVHLRDPETLESTLQFYLSNLDALAQKRAVARPSIEGLHDNAAIAREYGALYARRRAGGSPS